MSAEHNNGRGIPPMHDRDPASIRKEDEISSYKRLVHENMYVLLTHTGRSSYASATDQAMHYILALLQESIDYHVEAYRTYEGKEHPLVPSREQLRNNMISLLSLEANLDQDDQALLIHRSDAILHIALIFAETGHMDMVPYVIKPDHINMIDAIAAAGMCELPVPKSVEN